MKRREAEARKVQEDGLRIKEELEGYCIKTYGLALRSIYMASKKAPEKKTYKNPEDGKLYVYSGKGKVPKWLWINDANHKPNPRLKFGH
jgi:DNA-binding protein H-NS